MDAVCRLCLSFPQEGLNNLFANSELVQKIKYCLHVEISLEDSLPNQICCHCVDKIEAIHTFQLLVKENQSMLHHHLSLGTTFLQNFYTLLKKGIKDVNIFKVESNDNLRNVDRNSQYVDQNLLNVDQNSSDVDQNSLNVDQNSSDVDQNSQYTDQHLQVKFVDTDTNFCEQNNQNDEMKHVTFKGSEEGFVKLQNNEIEIVNNENICNEYCDSDDNIALVLFKENKTNSEKDIAKRTKKKKTEKLDKKKKTVIKYVCKDTKWLKKCTKETICIANEDNITGPDNVEDINAASNDVKTKDKKYKEEYINFEVCQCLTCLQILDSYQELVNHYKNNHKPVDLPKYDSNNFTTSNVDGRNLFKCNICEKTFFKKKSVMGHVRYKHDDRRPYPCKLCGRTFRLIHDVIRHLRAHYGVKLFCQYKCGYSTVYIASLKTHEKKHRNELYKCEKCDLTFQIKSLLKEHQNFHNKVKPFVCSECNMAFYYSRYLEQHMREKHAPVMSADATQNARFVCVHCTRRFQYKIHLQKHLVAEHGIKSVTSFLCDLCGKSFGRSSHLNHHKKMHQDFRGYTCSTCNKSFKTNSNLNRHSRVHTGYKKHVCSKCGKLHREKRLTKHGDRVHSTTAKK